MFSQNACIIIQVLIEVVSSQRGDSVLSAPKYITATELSRLYCLGRHILELQATIQHAPASRSTVSCQPSKESNLCEICCASNEKTQLPCGHSICEDCEKRWVSCKLTCPFCRTRFESAKKVAQNGWNLTEFEPELLQCDLQNVQEELNTTWRTAIQQKRRSCTQNYDAQRTMVALPLRLAEIRESEDFGLIDA